VSCSLNCLSLSDNDISDLSAFTKLEKITLIDCLEVKNISCLRQVSYLNFSGSFHIEDFSCLSSEYQKFVNLSRCKIQDNDALTLGNIPSLIIASCHKIQKITLSQGSRYFVGDSSSLVEVVLRGSEFLHVSLALCDYLQNVMIEGKVYFLNMIGSVDVAKTIKNKKTKYSYIFG
jgi:Leucine-rich repeat (LRR) protein